MARHRKISPAAAGAFGTDERSRWKPVAKKVKPALKVVETPKDDGVPYEKRGPAIYEVAATLKEMHDEMAWYPASPFMVVALKELIRRQFEISGPDGNYFLRMLGIEDIGELKEMGDMRGTVVADMLEACLLHMSEEERVSLGWQG